MGDGKWAGHPASDIWNEGSNWAGGKVPTGTATFGASDATVLRFADTSDATVDEIVFDAEAPSYSFLITVLAKTPSLTFTGQGVSSVSVCPQSFAVTSFGTYNQPQLKFTNSASAGDSQISYYAGPPDLETTYGGGTIAFHDDASAGAARFTVRTGKQRPPDRSSTLGGQIVFNDRARAGVATFSIFGTLGTDGDTFANAVFHDTASADRAVFTNHGGTVPGGDGGNTQFYDRSTAADGVYLNFGGSACSDAGKGANGGDVAFDGLATGGNGRFNNYPASVVGASGGVTSFNNNPNYPPMDVQGASAGNGTYLNFGATAAFPGSGGHTELTARYGNATAGSATFWNFGSAIASAAGAGHTSFSIGSPYAHSGEGSDPVTDFFPTAAQSTIWNLPGVAGGYTIFKVFDEVKQENQPTAEDATIHNLGAGEPGHEGGFTIFQDTVTAGNSTLIAQGGSDGGAGGRIIFRDAAKGGTARVILFGNGTLDLSGCDGGLTLDALQATGGLVIALLRPAQTALTLSDHLTLEGATLQLQLSLPSGQNLDPMQPYPILTAPNMADIDTGSVHVNAIDGRAPRLVIDGETLCVRYGDD